MPKILLMSFRIHATLVEAIDRDELSIVPGYFGFLMQSAKEKPSRIGWVRCRK